MEKQNQNILSWDDLIFENRNKAYGAYAIRQDYNNGVTKGALTGIGILVSVFILAGVVSKKPHVIPPVINDGTFVCSLPPNIVLPVEKHKISQPFKTVKANLPPVAVVTPDRVEPDPQPVTSTVGTEGATDGTAITNNGTPVNASTESGLGTLPVKGTKPFTHVEQMPNYKGGMEKMMKILRKNMHYPASARSMGKEGTVFVEFVITEAGDISDIHVIRGFDVDCDKEAVRIVSKLTAWNPGLQNKIAVNVKLVLPIKFQLEQ